jgi:hypothetical protein
MSWIDDIGETGGTSLDAVVALECVEAVRMIVTRFSGSEVSLCSLASGFEGWYMTDIGSGVGGRLRANFEVGISSGIDDLDSVPTSGVDLPDSGWMGGARRVFADSAFFASSIILFVLACLINDAIASSFLQSKDFNLAKQMSIDELMALSAKCWSRSELA